MIDAVRTISNQSSGKQGRALGLELLARGFDVTYVHANSIKGIPHATNKVFSNSNSLVNILNAELTDTYNGFIGNKLLRFFNEIIDGSIFTKLNNAIGRGIVHFGDKRWFICNESLEPARFLVDPSLNGCKPENL